MKVYASIVTFHTNHSDLNRLIDCVMNSPIEKLYIIDNSSNDELRYFVENRNNIQYIHSLNLGYGSGHNVAIKKSLEENANYHVVLNPDIYWTDNVIGELVRFMEENKDCGIVMPNILYPSGETQYLCKLLPTPVDLIVRRFVPIKSIQRQIDNRYELHRMGYDRIADVPSLSGCFMFMRCSVLKQVHGFDERFFMYSEDLDLCRRIGMVSRTVYYPYVNVTHEYEKGSYKNKVLLKYHIKSIIKYFNKWGWFFDSYRKKKNKNTLLQLNKL